MIVSQSPKKYQHRKEIKKMKKQKNYRKVAAVGRYFAMAFAVVLLCMVSQSISTIHADAKVTFDITADGVLKGIDGTAAVIKVPDGVKEIDGYAFSGNKTIEQIILPDSVQKLPHSCFAECSNLAVINMPNSIKEIGDWAFHGCSSLQMIDLSKTKISSIGDSMFWSCANLTEVKLPDSIKVIAKSSFAYCGKLGKINFPEGLRYIGDSAFDHTSALNTVELPESLRYIGSGAFGYSGLKGTLIIPAGIANLQSYTFEICPGLSVVKITDGTKYINSYALDLRDRLGGASHKTYFIPPSVDYFNDTSLTCAEEHTIYGIKGSFASNATKIKEEWKFQEVAYNSKVVFDASGGTVSETSKELVKGQGFGLLPTPKLAGWTFKGWYSDDKFKRKNVSTTIVNKDSYTLYAKWEKVQKTELVYQGEDSDFVIKDGVLKKYQGNEPVVIIPDTVKEIGYGAFEKDKTVLKVIMPDSVEKMENAVFNECENLMEIRFSHSLKEIPAHTCSNCFALEKVIIPEGVTNIGDGAFTSGNVPMSYSEIKFPETLKSIEMDAFKNNDSVTKISLPDGLESIGKYAFEKNTSLVKVSFGDGITELSEGVFSGDTILKNISLPYGLKSIGKNVFAENNSLEELYIPETVENIQSSMLGNVKSTVTIYSSKKDASGDNSAAYDYVESVNSQGGDLKCKFSEVQMGTVSFDSATAGTSYADKTKAIGHEYGSLPVPEKDGYDFVGWSETADGNNIITAFDRLKTPTVTLYAIWSKQVTEQEGKPTRIPLSEEEQEKDIVYKEINSVADFIKIRENLSGNYKLMSDIDLSKVTKDDKNVGKLGWIPFGYGTDGKWQGSFSGIFDGNNHSISGLTMKGNTDGSKNGETPYTSTGLFGRVEGGKLKNVNINDADITVSNAATGCCIHTGILAGFVDSDEETGANASVENVSVSGKVIFSSPKQTVEENLVIGGIIGYTGKADITNCTNNALVGYESKDMERPANPTSRFLGGITGYLQRGNITSCVNKGNVVSYRYYYGIYSDKSGDLIDNILSGLDCYNVSGGICGVAAQDGLIQKCYNSARIAAYATNTYQLESLIVNSHSDSMVGGICGALYLSTQVKNCYNTGNIYSHSDRETTIISPDNQGDDFFSSFMKILDSMTPTPPNQNVRAYGAGIVGYSTSSSSGPVAYCFNTGKIQGDDTHTYPILCGSVPVFYSVYEQQKDLEGNDLYTRGAESCKDKNSTTTARTTDELKSEDAFRGFDFTNVWVSAEETGLSYPQLYDNMEDVITDVKYQADGLKTEYKYGEKLDLSGLKVLYKLNGKTITKTVPDDKECDYDRFKEGTQKITINYCNVPYTFNVKVAEKLYKVIFTDSDGKTVIAEQELKKGQDATAPEAPAKEGYEFTGWDRSFTNVTRDIVVKAVYTKLYKVTFKSKDGQTELKVQYVRSGEAAEAPEAPEIEGYTFSRWSDDFTSVYRDMVITAYYDIIATPKPTKTPAPTKTPKPTSTPKPTKTPKPTATVKPTGTASPNESSNPDETVKPTETPAQTVTPTKNPNATASPTKTPLKKNQTVTPVKNNKKSDAASYKVTDVKKKTVTYSKTKTTSKKAVVHDTITVNGTKLKVTAVGASAFAGNKKIKTVTLGKNITKIGTKAFYKAKNLSQITVNGNTIKSIGKNAFSGVKKNCKITVRAKDKKQYKKIVKLIKKAGAKKVKFAYKKKK